MDHQLQTTFTSTTSMEEKCDQTDFGRGMIVSVRQAGFSISITANLLFSLIRPQNVPSEALIEVAFFCEELMILLRSSHDLLQPVSFVTPSVL